jgi:dethiobiotin synthetase
MQLPARKRSAPKLCANLTTTVSQRHEMLQSSEAFKYQYLRVEGVFGWLV